MSTHVSVLARDSADAVKVFIRVPVGTSARDADKIFGISSLRADRAGVALCPGHPEVEVHVAIGTATDGLASHGQERLVVPEETSRYITGQVADIE